MSKTYVPMCPIWPVPTYPTLTFKTKHVMESVTKLICIFNYICFSHNINEYILAYQFTNNFLCITSNVYLCDNSKFLLSTHSQLRGWTKGTLTYPNVVIILRCAEDAFDPEKRKTCSKFFNTLSSWLKPHSLMYHQ